jgi:hypothetical protein
LDPSKGTYTPQLESAWISTVTLRFKKDTGFVRFLWSFHRKGLAFQLNHAKKMLIIHGEVTSRIIVAIKQRSTGQELECLNAYMRRRTIIVIGTYQTSDHPYINIPKGAAESFRVRTGLWVRYYP